MPDKPPIPDRQISDEQVEAYRSVYKELIGFVPPRIQARTDLLSRVDPELLDMQEALRQHCMYPKEFDVKTAQLMIWGIMLTQLNPAARLHGIAALRAGASLEELSAVVNLVFLFRGLSAANLGAELIQNMIRDGDVP
ncbi:MAG: carboxymuconolactone decarboxylase family protein [Anaerolineae bacterium]|nr:carboxymuconolactone decarboxylase family protein [Anaerolineae bacterium]